MAEYIERRRLFNALADHWSIPRDWDGGIEQPCNDALAFIENAPEADVVEVKHGRWKYDFALDGSNFYKCSLCGRQEVLQEKEDIAEWCPYCHCGAKMDGDE